MDIIEDNRYSWIKTTKVLSSFLWQEGDVGIPNQNGQGSLGTVVV
jgi:hypothetical protein